MNDRHGIIGTLYLHTGDTLHFSLEREQLTDDELDLLDDDWGLEYIRLPVKFGNATCFTAREYLLARMAVDKDEMSYLVRFEDLIQSKNLCDGMFDNIHILNLYRNVTYPDSDDSTVLNKDVAVIGYRSNGGLNEAFLYVGRPLTNTMRAKLGKVWTLVTALPYLCGHSSRYSPGARDSLQRLLERDCGVSAIYGLEYAFAEAERQESYNETPSIQPPKRVVTIGFKSAMTVDLLSRGFVAFAEDREVLSDELARLKGRWSVIRMLVPTTIEGVHCETAHAVVAALPLNSWRSIYPLDDILDDMIE